MTPSPATTRRRLLAVVPTLALGAVMPTSAWARGGGPPVPPDTPVGRQLAWLLDAARRLPVPEAEARAHLAPALFESLGVAGLNDMLRAAAGHGTLRLDSYRAQREPRAGSEAYALLTGAGTRHAVLVTDGSGALAAVYLSPLPVSWAEIDRRIAALGPRASFLAAEIDGTGRCRPVHGLAAEVPRPMGSAVKLYVLGALADAARGGRASWDEPLAVREEWRAPGGPVWDLPVGATPTLREYAEHMIFHSDNSATDHLIGRLGREAVEAQQGRLGMTSPRANVPLLATRELTVLKTVDYPRHADAYTALDGAGRRAYLDRVVAGLPVPGTSWSEPRHVDSVEWFATPGDLCRALAGLWRQAGGDQGQEPVHQALSLMGTRILGLDPTAWPVGWFKGGAEPGVLSRTFLARTADGRTFAVSVMVSDPERNVGGAAAVSELLALLAGAFRLLAAGPRNPAGRS
ncbi:serine hydrolase [Streptomyces millisiae]|uniref:Beta-lactamase n=1 Tax=Streptomyces millisiae TaxID=3075542 RepID=A0ABU2LRL3_9ACTN|nr:serine hydrolase [Streptomyces sp. DSM 44918]MDT0320224.1 serine hydrolase [Streptomyces sp. DSM 44918]